MYDATKLVYLVYAVIVTNHPDYTRTLLQNYHHKKKNGGFPVLRLNLESSQDVKVVLTNEIIKLLITEFDMLTFQGIEYIGRYDNKSIYRVRFTGWPQPETSGIYTWLPDPLDGEVNFSGREILRRVRRFERHHLSPDTNYLAT